MQFVTDNKCSHCMRLYIFKEPNQNYLKSDGSFTKKGESFVNKAVFEATKALEIILQENDVADYSILRAQVFFNEILLFNCNWLENVKALFN